MKKRTAKEAEKQIIKGLKEAAAIHQGRKKVMREHTRTKTDKHKGIAK